MSESKLIVQEALDNFNQSEEYLVKHNLSERCVCARFARYLEATLHNYGFKSYVVDVEYNRDAYSEKTNPKSIMQKELGPRKRIVVDLVAHRRGNGLNNNLICIEMKKSNNKIGLETDRARLQALTKQDGHFHYAAGFMIIIDNNPKQHKFLLEIDSSYPSL